MKTYVVHLTYKWNHKRTKRIEIRSDKDPYSDIPALYPDWNISMFWYA